MPSFGEIDAWLRKHKKSARIRQARHLKEHTKNPQDKYAERWWWNELIRADFCETLLSELIEWCSEEYRKEAKAGHINFVHTMMEKPRSEREEKRG
jgi:hypothetical protein